MPIFKRTLLARLISFMMPGIVEGGGSAGGGGGDDAAPTITPEVQAIIDAKISEAVTGLKSKNGELLGKLKDATTNLQRFDGIDPEAVRTILSKFASDEEAGLLKAGKIDEVLNKRTERMQGEHAKVIKAEQEARVKAEGKASKLAAKALQSEIFKVAASSGAEKFAYDDIWLRAQGTWHLNDDGDPVAMNGDEVILSKDGKTPLTPQEWAESLRETAPHLWPKAQGTNAPGSAGAGGGKSDPKGNFGGTKQERMAAIGSMSWTE